MDIQEAIRKRRTHHLFSREKVPEEIIEKAIDAANYAPSHKLIFPWRFTRVGMNKREQIATLALKLRFTHSEGDKKQKQKIKDKILNPSHLIVASQISTDDQLQKKEDYAACACAIQNLSLSLTADGVGSKWSSGKMTKDINIYQIVEINPEEQEIIGFIWIGYGQVPSIINRPSLSSIFRKI
tara:strand:+ start:7162 stop:7710 length:549 start_codon:yes stop_codon:yes gene_type:complete